MCLQFRPQVTCLLEYQFNRSIVSNSLQSIGLEHARLPCPSPTPRACSNSCPSRVMSSNHLIFCRPLLLLPSIFPSVRVFSNESVIHIRYRSTISRPKYSSFSFSISPSNEYSVLISFRTDWFDLLVVQVTLKSINSVQFRVTQSCPTLCDPMNHSMPGLPVHHQLPEFTQIHVRLLVMPFNHLILCCPIRLLPSVFPSITVFSHESVLLIE